MKKSDIAMIILIASICAFIAFIVAAPNPAVILLTYLLITITPCGVYCKQGGHMSKLWNALANPKSW